MYVNMHVLSAPPRICPNLQKSAPRFLTRTAILPIQVVASYWNSYQCGSVGSEF